MSRALGYASSVLLIMAARLRTFSLPFSRLAIASRQFSSDIKAISCPMDVPLPGAPLSRHVRLADLPVRETRVTTLENGIQVASEDCFGQYCTVGGSFISVCL